MKNSKRSNQSGIPYYLELAKSGHFPLFDLELIQKNQVLSNVDYKKNNKYILKKFFKKLSSHRNVERKQTVINAMSEENKSIFLKAYFSALEEEILKDEYTYH